LSTLDDRLKNVIAPARFEIADAISRCVKKYPLTYRELVSILAVEILGWQKEDI